MPSPQRIGRYELVMPLGSSGTSKVYVARAREQSGFERYVVLKTFDAGDDHPRLVDEARLLAQLHHHHIAPVCDLGNDGGRLFLVLEYVHGHPASEVWQRFVDGGAAVPYGFALTVSAAAASALHYAHTRTSSSGRALRIVHRDVSPANLMIGFDGAVKLIDFGLANDPRQAELTSDKIGYLTPEQLRGAPVDARTDVFALGIVLYELTTMRHAFRDKSDRITVERIKSATLVAPSKIVPGYPPELEKIIKRALQLDPDDRFPDANTIRHEIEVVAHRMELVLGDVAVSQVMSQLFEDTRAPWLREHATTLGGEEFTDPSRPAVDDPMDAATVLGGPLVPEDARTEDDDDETVAVFSEPEQETILRTDEPAPIMMPSSQKLKLERERIEDFDSGAMTAIAASPESTPTPTPMPISVFAPPGSASRFATQIAAVPPPVRVSAVAVPTPSALPGSLASMAGANVAYPVETVAGADPRFANAGFPMEAVAGADPRFAETIPPTDAASLGIPPVNASLTSLAGAYLEAAMPPVAEGLHSMPPVAMPPVAPPAPGPNYPVLPPLPRTRPTAPRRKRTALILGLLVSALLGAAATVVWWLLTREPDADDATVANVTADAAMSTADAPEPNAVAADAAALDATAAQDATIALAVDATAMIRLQITSVPPGATVLLDGRRLGKTPYDEMIEAAPGKHALKLRRNGYNAVKLEVELTENLTRAVELKSTWSDEPVDSPD
jgi:serine/threonine protein kinase